MMVSSRTSRNIAVIDVLHRLVFDVLVLWLFLVMPWWIGSILAISGAILFSRYIEIIFFSWLLDGLYGGFTFEQLEIPWATVVAMSVFASVHVIRKFFRL